MISLQPRSETGWSNDYYGLVLDILMRDEEVSDIGQFTPRQKRLLARAVENGDLSMDAAAGPFPKAKRC